MSPVESVKRIGGVDTHERLFSGACVRLLCR